jgi:hypothetical protein
MSQEHIFLKVNLPTWIDGTIAKFEEGVTWNSAWQQTYQEIGGKSAETGRKGCPMNAARTLYELGRLTGHSKAPQTISLSKVWQDHSKNGAYAIAAIECLNKDPDLSLSELWQAIQQKIRQNIGEEPAASNQGGPTLTFKLWHLGLIQ